MKKLSKKDAKKYLEFGGLCQPFLTDEVVKEKVYEYQRARFEEGEELDILESLAGWMSAHLKKRATSEQKSTLKFKRTAKEVWESEFVTGCTDNGVLFATFAKQMGIPATVLNTVAESMMKDMKRSGEAKSVAGHTFCECLIDDTWVLVDPTRLEFMWEYDAEKITLPYTVGGNKVYIPYKRGAFKEFEESQKVHCDFMRAWCLETLEKNPNIVVLKRAEGIFGVIDDAFESPNQVNIEKISNQISNHFMEKYNTLECPVFVKDFKTSFPEHAGKTPAFIRTHPQRKIGKIYLDEAVAEKKDIARIVKLIAHEWGHYYEFAVNVGQTENISLDEKYKQKIAEAKNVTRVRSDGTPLSDAKSKFSPKEVVADAFKLDFLQEVAEKCQSTCAKSGALAHIDRYRRRTSQMACLMQENGLSGQN